MRRIAGACVVFAALAQAGAALAVNDPVLVRRDPSANQARRSLSVSEVKATYDRQLKMPPDSTIELRDKNNNLVAGHVVTTGAGGAGEMSLIFRPDALLSESLSPYTTKATAAPTPGGDTTTSSWVFLIDDTPPAPPAITSPPQNSLLQSTSVGVAGTTAAGQVVALKENSVTLGTAVADGSGAWQMNRTFADGSHSIVATTFDAAGNESAASAARSFTVDSTAPAAPIIATPAQGATLTSSSVPLGGTAESNATITIKEATTTVASAVADANGDWNSTATFADGSHVVTATATDAAGNASAASSGRSFTVDLGAPSLLTADPPDQRVVASATRLTSTWTKTIASSSAIEVRDKTDALVNGSTQINGSTMTFTPSAGTFGGGNAPYTWTAQAFDSHGNASPVSTLHFGIGGAPAIDTPADNALVGTHTVDVTGTGPAGMTATVREGATSLGSGTIDADGKWHVNVTLADGVHAVTAVATDAAGNSTGATAARSFVVDTGPPAAPVITSPPEGAFIETASTTVSGTSESGARVHLFDGANEVAQAIASASGAWSLARTFTDGAHSLSASATDAAGNTGPLSGIRHITVQRAAPAAPVITHPAQGTAVNRAQMFFSGTAAAGTTVHVKEGTTVVVTTTTGPSGVWVATFTLANGPHDVTATAFDAGKSSAASAVRSFVVDTVPPSVHISTPNASVFAPGTTALGGTAADAAGIASVDVLFQTLAGTTLATMRADVNGPPQDATWSLLPQGLLPGVYQVRAYATDRAANTAYSDETIVILSLG